MYKGVSEFNITDFNGGLLTSGNPFLAKANTSPNCLNVYADRFGNLVRRDGITAVNSTDLGGGTGYGLFDYEVNASQRKIVFVIDDKIYKMDNWDGVYDEIGSGFIKERWCFCNFNNTLLMVSPSNVAQYWDGASDYTTDLPQIPYGTSRIIAWKQRIWAIGADDHDLRYSAPNDYTDWPSENTWGIFSYAGDANQALALLRDFLFVFKKHSIYKVAYLGGSPLLDVQDTGALTGTISSDTVRTVVWQGRKGLMFLGTDGKVYFFDGYNAPLAVSDPISDDNGEAPFDMTQLNLGAIENAHAVVWPDYNWYILFIPKKPSSTNNYALVFDYSKAPMAIWVWDNMNASCSAICKFKNKNRALFIDYDGDLQRMQYGNDDNGTPITAYWYSPHMIRGSVATLKGSRFVRITLKNVGDFTLKFRYRTGWDTDWQEEEFTMLGGGDVLGSTFVLGQSALGGDRAVDKDLALPVHSNHIQFGVYSDGSIPSFEIYSMVEILSTPAGVGKG